tara:strand:+ start:2284 stop:2544 length:261 start_codon:yes stop_codon:yes gene_type:complete
MLLQLKTGFTIEIPTEVYLDMTDEELQELECLGPSQLMEINNPFYKSYAGKTKLDKPVSKEETKALYDVPDQEKLDEYFDHEKEDY